MRREHARVPHGVKPLEVAQDASAGDLKPIGHIGGRKMRQRSEHEPTVRRRGVDAVQEDDGNIRPPCLIKSGSPTCSRSREST